MNLAESANQRRHGLLSLFVAASYATTLLRDVFLVTQRSNSRAADNAILSIGTGSGIAAVIGIAVLLLRGAGRSTKVPALVALFASLAGVISLGWIPTIGLGLASGGFALLFTLAQSAAAERNHLIYSEHFCVAFQFRHGGGLDAARHGHTFGYRHRLFGRSIVSVCRCCICRAVVVVL